MSRAQALTSEDAPAAHLNPAALAVPVEHAIVQTGMVDGPLSALVAADAALRYRSTTTAALEAAVAACAGAAGMRAVAAILRHADARAESPPETLARHALRLLGYAVEPQVPVEVGGTRYRLDLALPTCRLAVEVDGAVKYSGPDARAVVMEEKGRHVALRGAGWIVVRMTWADIVGPAGELRLDHMRAVVTCELAA